MGGNDNWHGANGYRPPERRDGPADSPRSPDSNQIWQLFRSLVPPEDDKIRRDELVSRVRALVRRQWPDAELHQYGSTANDLCLRHADVDLCLTVPRSVETPVETIVEELGVLLERCTHAGRAHANCSGISALLTDSGVRRDLNSRDDGRQAAGEHACADRQVQGPTQVRCPQDGTLWAGGPDAGLTPWPLVRNRWCALQICSRISCDVCFNNLLAVQNTRMLHTYIQIDDRVRPLIFAVKHWAKARRINEPYAGTLSRSVPHFNN